MSAGDDNVAALITAGLQGDGDLVVDLAAVMSADAADAAATVTALTAFAVAILEVTYGSQAAVYWSAYLLQGALKPPS